MKSRVLLALLLALSACKKGSDDDAGPARDAGPRARSDAGVFSAIAPEDPENKDTKTATDDPSASDRFYQVPWRSESERAIFELRMPLPSGSLLVTEEVDSPIKRYTSRREKMSFFVERRGLRGMPQTLPLKDAADWYLLLYQAQNISGPTDTVFAGKPALRIEFESQQADELLHVALLLTFRGGYIYGMGIESTLPKRVLAAADRLQRKARFIGDEPTIEIGPYDSISDLSLAMPGAAGLIQSRALGGVSLTDKGTRFHMLISRVPAREALWAENLETMKKALIKQRFVGFEQKKAGKGKVGNLAALHVAYVTEGKGREGKVFIDQLAVNSQGYVYLFTASADERYEKLVPTWSAKVLQGARFLKPF